ncbi:DUF2164 domain-containing protein [Pseudomonas sichuanensis]|uniref:DUF2164 domain-containing protein n=1 Tax=Pseudomonas TaxID=286 RepID=UPI00129A31F5|nr:MULTISPECIES: DUF2164 domain-containing protein [Pseudomonas]MDH0730557.1 DUF2164 domain-containing protein [Pseudomonas sichuanensis]MDH1583228.1 DUF2164 domain-containing protein [Pseudomonas sichuanensis]MDH1595527.1 DUF2164 domain-containing protein [Pseudomonas sichuanensis]MDH1596493.1 DUF2164 domain-containing protein [Pseudomonas sichuanensis]MDU9401423.1 DUF2164 domain-containing protein [Pseudomonas sp. zfem004]
MSRSRTKAPILTLAPEQEREALDKLKRFLEDRFELELGSFEVAEVLEVFSREVAPYYYNRAIADVQLHLKERFESIESDLWALEKP